MKGGGRLERRTRLRHNAKRRAKRHAQAFGPPGFVEFVHRYGCVVAREHGPLSCGGPVEAAHVGSRLDGWRNNVAGLCRDHHTAAPGSFHHLGSAAAFDKRWGMDLDLWAAAVTHQFDLLNGEG